MFDRVLNMPLHCDWGRNSLVNTTDQQTQEVKVKFWIFLISNRYLLVKSVAVNIDVANNSY